ncbi:cytochrome c [Paracoccus sp. AK26]|uniref:c-type cytochrome n=1 Tax=Paracoccus sp. AK26 TaxID=2589076 RepID=UPI0014282AE0|nr:cytochrome c [Paracoccus sp. AK26]QIR86685.1 cytochrome c [Paracoccus sp. AK26]
MKKPLVIGLISGIIGTILLAIIVWLIVVYTGTYNVAATDPHQDAVRWSFETTLHRSVAQRAEAVVLPEEVSEDLLSQGASHYAESCAHCHGDLGQEPAVWSQGMRPEPPHLAGIAAIVSMLPGLSAQDYQSLTGNQTSADEAAGSGHH